jgi:hypothetical protein
MADKQHTSVFHDKLYTLEIALEAEQMKAPFTMLARKCLGEEMEVRNIQVEVIRRRNQRCVIRYRVETFDPREQQRLDWGVIGKVYKARRGERVYRLMQRLWENGFSREARDEIYIPEPLDFSSDLCMLFQEEVPGLPLKVLAKQNPTAFHFRQLARTLAKLHRCPIVPDNPFLVQEHFLRCHPRYPFLALACPELETKIDYIAATAKRIEAQLIAGDLLTPIHGDFHLGQVHLENGSAWLIDFDALAYGDPASDLGNLLVFLRGKIKKMPEYAKLIEVFLEEYYAIMGSELGRRILLYEGLTHLRRACKLLRLQDEGWRRRVARMIDQGVASIEEMGKTVHVVEDFLAPIEEEEDLIEAMA